MIKNMLLILGMLFSATVSAKEADGDIEWTKRQGVRLGYGYVNGVEHTPLKNRSLFVMGYEMQQARNGGSWLEILFIQNISISGLDQSVFAPSASMLAGAEINKQIQIGVGPNFAPFDPSDGDNYFHLVGAIGATIPAGDFSVPFHCSFIPDVDGYWRLAVTTGVNW